MGESRKVGVLSDQEAQAYAQRPQSTDRKARIGFIGAGWWATTNHMPLLAARADVEMVSVCGLDEAILQRCCDDFGFAHSTTDYHELLQQNLDGVVVASPHGLHAEHAGAALRQGCHVMVEKPFTTQAQDAREIVQAAQENDLHIVVPYGWHYRPLSRKAKDLMDQSLIGNVEFVLCHMASPLKNLMSGTSFDFSDDAYVDTNLSTWADPEVSGGGYGQGQLSHATGLMLWLTGLQPYSVFARMSEVGSQVDMYDSISVSCHGGAIANVSGAATLPADTPGTFQLDIRIFGERGVVLLDIERERLALHTHDGEHREINFEPGDGAYQCDGPPHQFVELILGLTDQNASPGELAMRSVELLDAAYRSSRSGKDENV